MGIEYSDIPISLLRQFWFCRRIPFLIQARGLNPPRGPWVKLGTEFHAAVEHLVKRRDLSQLGFAEKYSLEIEKQVYAPQLGIHGVCDGLITTDSGHLFPIEFKMSQKQSLSNGEIVQLAAYCLAFEEMYDKKIENGFALCGKRTTSILVPITDSLRKQVHKTIHWIKQDFENGLLPDSSSNDKKCCQCEFLNFCADRL